MKNKKFLIVAMVLATVTGAIAFDSQTDFVSRSISWVSYSSKTEVPDYVLYDNLFRIISALKAKADSKEPNGERITGMINHFKEGPNLTDSENQILQNLAFDFTRDASEIDIRARSVIQETRRKFLDRKQAINEPPPDELIALQQERNQLALQYRDRLRDLLGEVGFARFDKFVKSDFAASLKTVPLSSVDFSKGE